MKIKNGIYLRAVMPWVPPWAGLSPTELLDHYQRSQWLSADELAARQWKALQRLLRHAYETTEYYPRRWKAIGLRPEDIREPRDMEHIPLLRRDTLRTEMEAMTSNRYRREELQRSLTGGTTNTPVPFRRDLGSVAHKRAIQTLLNGWASLWPGDRAMHFWGAQVDLAQEASWRWRAYERYVLRVVYAQTTHMTPEILEEYRASYERFRPEVVYGYASGLEHFCEYARQAGGLKHRPRAVISTAEALEERRSLLGEIFQAPVFEHYGAREFGMIGAECVAHDGMHLHPEAAFVEFRPIEGTRDEGLRELVVTDLLNMGMPLIRYVSDDCAVPTSRQCTCGRKLPMIARFAGRRNAMFKLPDGSQVLGMSLPRLIQDRVRRISKVQIIQETRSEFELKYVSETELSATEADTLRTFLREYFQNDLEWRLKRVDDVPRESSGKVRPCISLVQA